MTNSSRLIGITSVVMSIIAFGVFIYAIFTLSLVVYNETQAIDQETMITTKLEIQSLELIVEEYKSVYGAYPNDLSQLVGVYLERVPFDTWQNRYRYELLEHENNYRIYTLGKGNTVGGIGVEADYDNFTDWKLVSKGTGDR